jgi:hypothetical protein
MTDMTPEADLVVQYPSEDFPAPPPIRLTVPGDWEALPRPDAVLAVRSRSAVDGYRPNVVVRIHPIATDDLTAASPTAFDAAPADFEVIIDEPRDLGDMRGRMTTIRQHDPDGVSLEARRLVVLVPGSRHVAHAISVIGTYPSTAPATVVDQVAAVVDSLLVQVVISAGAQ